MRRFTLGRAVWRSASALRPADGYTSRCGEAFRICACWWSAATAPDWIRCRYMRCWRITASCSPGRGLRLCRGRAGQSGRAKKAMFILRAVFPSMKTVINKQIRRPACRRICFFYFFRAGRPPPKNIQSSPTREARSIHADAADAEKVGAGRFYFDFALHKYETDNHTTVRPHARAGAKQVG